MCRSAGATDRIAQITVPSLAVICQENAMIELVETARLKTEKIAFLSKSIVVEQSGGCTSCAQTDLLGQSPKQGWHDEYLEAVPEHIQALYEQAIVIDALSTPNTFNVDYPPAGPSLSMEQLENVRRSGITVVNHTIFATDLADYWEKIRLMKLDIAQNSETLMLIEQPADVFKAKASGKLGIALGFQGMEFLQSDLSLIEAFCTASVRIMQLTYNQESALGAGCLAETSTPWLKGLGHDAVGRINHGRSVLDLSHSHPLTALDAVKASRDPVIVSHSACHALHAHPRNHPDEVLRAVAGSGGVFGIYLMPFLGDEPVFASRDLVTRHILHALNVCGEDHVGIGSDNSITPLQLDAGYYEALGTFVADRRRNGSASPAEGLHPFMVPGLNNPRRLEIIAWDLSRAGCSDDVVEKILGSNFFRVFEHVWSR
jgi:membrane dipeptidase